MKRCTLVLLPCHALRDCSRGADIGAGGVDALPSVRALILSNFASAALCRVCLRCLFNPATYLNRGQPRHNAAFPISSQLAQ